MSEKINPALYNGVSDDSRNVKKGDVFFAIEGARFDGGKFIEEALRKGAAAVVADKTFNKKINGAKIIRVPNPRIEMARFACDFYGRPSQKVKVVGITGTNGKTTISYLLASIFKKAGYEMGIIGTIAHRWKDRITEAMNTTPGTIELQKLLSMMAADSVKYCAMEVSSHSLDQDRVFGIDFNAAIFTNITSEHLDYHKQFENYLMAKEKLFRNLKSNRTAILNLDDENCEKIKRGTCAKILTYAIKKNAAVRAEAINISSDGTEFLVRAKDASFLLKSPLVGMFNVYNILAAVSYALKEGIPVKIIQQAVSDFKGTEGRLEAVDSNGDFKIFIDYAHTDNALENVLSALRAILKNRLIVVFGCGGDRDKFKRPRMGNIASRLADYVFITSDNPRSENPLTIAKEIESGMNKKFKDYKIVLDRYTAINEAISYARPGDAVLVAGKGHEKYQIAGNKVLPFSDRAVIEEIISKKVSAKKCLTYK